MYDKIFELLGNFLRFFNVFFSHVKEILTCFYFSFSNEFYFFSQDPFVASIFSHVIEGNLNVFLIYLDFFIF